MKFENTEVFNINGAIRAMRNPLESWVKADSKTIHSDKGTEYQLGENDLDLIYRLIKAGTEHRKFLRQIFVSVDITAPRYWWTEFDTYKIGVTRNSCSTMHKLASTPITYDSFAHSDLILTGLPETLEEIRKEYQNTNNKELFIKLKSNLPESFLQKSTVTMNYENILTMYKQRHNHRLEEWSKDFVQWVHSLPYADEFIKDAM